MAIFNLMKTPSLSLLGLVGLSLLFSISTKAQTLKGWVLDKKKQEPLPYALVSQGKFGTTTDANGYFELRLKNFKETVKFYSFGYETRMILTDSSDLNITVELKVKTNQLAEVAIVAERKVAVVDKKQTVVLDYGFRGTNILVLTQEDVPKKFKLSLLDQNLDTIVSQVIPVAWEKLFTDCFGQLHLLSKDSVYQLFNNTEDIFLLYPAERKFFEKFMEPYITSTDDYLYRMEKSGSRTLEMSFFKLKTNQRTVRYTAIDRKGKKQTELTTIGIDKGSSKMANNEDRYIAMLDKGGAFRNQLDKESSRIFAEKIIYKEIFAPLFNQNDSILIFNFPQDQLEIYSNNRLIGNKRTLEFHKEKGWKPELIQDKTQNLFYSKYELAPGRISFYPVTIFNGKMGNSIEIPYQFPEKIKANGHFIYFLYRNPVDRNLALGRIWSGN